MNKKQTQPAWVACDCGEYWCNIHQTHAWECDCPPIEDWSIDPYQSPTGASAPLNRKKRMKPSHLTTPRNFADCTWIQGYGRQPSLWQRIQGPVLAIGIGIGMAALLVAWWSS